MFIISIFSQQDILENAVCPSSLGSDPAFLQPPHSPLCPVVRDLGPCELGTAAEPGALPPHQPGDGRACMGTATRARRTPALQAARAPELPAEQTCGPRHPQSENGRVLPRPRGTALCDGLWKSPSSARGTEPLKRSEKVWIKTTEHIWKTRTQEGQLGQPWFCRTALTKVTKSLTEQNTFSAMPVPIARQKRFGVLKRDSIEKRMTLQLKPTNGAKRSKCVNKREALEKHCNSHPSSLVQCGNHTASLLTLIARRTYSYCRYGELRKQAPQPCKAFRQDTNQDKHVANYFFF